MVFEFQQMLDSVRDSRFGFDINQKGEVLTGCASNADRLRERYALVEHGKKNGLIPETLEAPLGAQLELTFRCNSRCIHCYNDSSHERFKQANELSQEEWLGIARQLGEMGVFNVVISGGEPLLLRERLFEIMDLLATYGVAFVFITNGSLVTPEVVRRLRHSNYRWCWLQVSIDGDTPELHDYVRGHPGSWEKATRALRMFARSGIPVKVAHTITRRNLHRFQEMADLAYSLGAYGMITSPCLPSGRAAGSEEAQALLLNSAERESFIDEVEKARKRLGRRERKFDIRPGGSVSVNLRIRAIEPSQVLLIRPDGEVKVDCILPHTIGNVREANLKTIWDNGGRDVWRHPDVLNYINEIEQQEHMLEKDVPRPHVGVSPRVG